jgi:hypothetical protein
MAEEYPIIPHLLGLLAVSKSAFLCSILSYVMQDIQSFLNYQDFTGDINGKDKLRSKSTFIFRIRYALLEIRWIRVWILDRYDSRYGVDNNLNLWIIRHFYPR